MGDSVPEKFSFIEVVNLLTPFDQMQPHERTVIGIDPGETTGICLIHEGKLVFTTQIDHREHKDIAQAAFDIQIKINEWVENPLNPCPESFTIAYEEYRVYQQKAMSHSYSDLFTSRLIGAIEYMCRSNNWHKKGRMASSAKGMMTDRKLKLWGFWIKGKKHSRDAIRHACTFTLITANHYKKERKRDGSG